MRRRNATRREVLFDSIERFLRDRVEVSGDGAGTHIVLWPKRRAAERQIIAEARARGILIYGVAPYHLTKPHRPGLLLGYSRLKESEIREGIRRLSEVV